ncbi:MAG: hypothetical protein IJD16_09505 [Desulfovibrio sp.]|nr:hypothetical protein [Desulfovibrio sp.]
MSHAHTRHPRKFQSARGTIGVSAPQRASIWPRPELLFPPLSADCKQALEHLPEVLQAVWPLSRAHRRSLPDDIAALSRLLTVERRDLRHPYWSTPAFISAYLYYFLPWNIVRLSRLLAALPLPAPAAVPDAEALLMDVGSGPLTLPLALWLARPSWRAAPIRVLALDSAARPLELGKALLKVWGQRMGWPVWSVRTACGSLESLPRQAAPMLRGEKNCYSWLITAANVINELRPVRKGRAEDFPEEDSADGLQVALSEESKVHGQERLGGVLNALAPLLFHSREALQAVVPSLLFVEPGTRLGGMTIMQLRALALEGGLASVLPCLHDAACPLLAGQAGRTWCHFTFDCEGAPGWLQSLSREAGLGKTALSLSPLLLQPVSPVRSAHDVRVISAPFFVPGLRGKARYACGAGGLVLLEDATGLHSGSSLPVQIPHGGRRDAKSQALIVPRPSGSGRKA